MKVRGLTGKQIEILTHVRNRNPDGTYLSVKQIHEAVSYKCSKQSISCSLKFLVTKGLIVKTEQTVIRGGLRHAVVTITELGEKALEQYVPSLKSILIESEEI